MPRSSKKVASTAGKVSPDKVKRPAQRLSKQTAAPESAVAPGRGVTDAELYGYPAYEYPGYDTDPDLNVPEQDDDDWLTAEPDPEPDPESPLDWDQHNDDDWLSAEPDLEPLPDWNQPNEEEPYSQTLPLAAAQHSLGEGPHSLLDYFAAHALNGLLAGNKVLDAAQTARLAYDCAEAMLREKQERMAN